MSVTIHYQPYRQNAVHSAILKARICKAMPRINEYKCSQCGFTLETGWGYRFYVEDDNGRRVDCYHPMEGSNVVEVLGEHPSLELIRERTGFNSFCVCLDCLEQFKADLGQDGWSPYDLYLEHHHLPRSKQAKDKRQCPMCRSKRVKAELELAGETCPKCNEGVIEEIWTGRVS